MIPTMGNGRGGGKTRRPGHSHRCGLHAPPVQRGQRQRRTNGFTTNGKGRGGTHGVGNAKSKKCRSKYTSSVTAPTHPPGKRGWLKPKSVRGRPLSRPARGGPGGIAGQAGGAPRCDCAGFFAGRLPNRRNSKFRRAGTRCILFSCAWFRIMQQDRRDTLGCRGRVSAG